MFSGMNIFSRKSNILLLREGMKVLNDFGVTELFNTKSMSSHCGASIREIVSVVGRGLS